VKRSLGDYQGLAFDEELVSDDEGGFKPRHRVSPLMMAQIGLNVPSTAGKPRDDAPSMASVENFPVFRTTLVH
jgi:hypothetical protein